jgi:hypothetical protein
MMMDRDKLATFLVKQYEQPLSACEIATNVFKFLTELNKSQTVKFKKPKKFGKDKNN